MSTNESGTRMRARPAFSHGQDSTTTAATVEVRTRNCECLNFSVPCYTFCLAVACLNEISMSLRAASHPSPLTWNKRSTTPINYLSRASQAQLRLIHGDAETFSDVLSLIGEYEV